MLLKKLKLPALKSPTKKLIGMAAMASVLGTGITGVYNFASAKMDERKQAVVMQAAATCEDKLLNKGVVCTLAEQKALLAREDIERRKWKGGVKAGISILLTMSAF